MYRKLAVAKPVRMVLAWGVLSLLLFCAPANAQKGNEDSWLGRNYYDAATQTFERELLGKAERNHLSQENYWLKYKSGDLVGALEDLKYVLLVFPNHPKALHLLGTLCRTMKDNVTPIIYYEKAVRTFPNIAYTHTQYASYLIASGDVSGGIARLKEALEIDPNSTYALALLATAEKKERAGSQTRPDGAAGRSGAPAASVPTPPPTKH